MITVAALAVMLGISRGLSGFARERQDRFRKLARDYAAQAQALALSTRIPVSFSTPRLIGYDLQLMSWGDGSKVPTSGQSLVIAGTDSNGLLHIRTFNAAGVRTDTYEAMEGGTLHRVSADALGNISSDSSESSLSAPQAHAIAGLKQQLPGLLPPHVLTQGEDMQFLGEATLITGQTLIKDSSETMRFERRYWWLRDMSAIYEQAAGQPLLPVPPEPPEPK